MASAERQARARLQKLEKHKNRIKGTGKPKTMPVSEWEYATHLLRQNPNLIVISHPDPFVVFDRLSDKRREYKPDFLVVDPKANPPSETYVEITLAPKNKLPQNSKKDEEKIKTASGDVFDAKARQREIMSEAAPDANFVVLYEHDLKQIQQNDKDFDPWRSENINRPHEHSRRNNSKRRR
jgi:hypothetical protein